MEGKTGDLPKEGLELRAVGVQRRCHVRKIQKKMEALFIFKEKNRISPSSPFRSSFTPASYKGVFVDC